MAVTKTVNVETTNARASTTLTDTTPTVPLPDTPQGLMVIGPQVTLHFVEDAWNKANSYDYYDVVQVDGTSYIAVQDVPANTEITNTTYWAKWNDPNAQLELLQTTVSEYSGKIDNAQNTANDAKKVADAANDLLSEMVTLNDNIGMSGSEDWGFVPAMESWIKASNAGKISYSAQHNGIYNYNYETNSWNAPELVDGKYTLDCMQFVLMCMQGITYESSMASGVQNIPVCDGDDFSIYNKDVWDGYITDVSGRPLTYQFAEKMYKCGRFRNISNFSNKTVPEKMGVLKQLKPGDIVFTGDKSNPDYEDRFQGIYHAAIFLGTGKDSTGNDVAITVDSRDSPNTISFIEGNLNGGSDISHLVGYVRPNLGKTKNFTPTTINLFTSKMTNPKYNPSMAMMPYLVDWEMITYPLIYKVIVKGDLTKLSGYTIMGVREYDFTDSEKSSGYSAQTFVGNFHSISNNIKWWNLKWKGIPSNVEATYEFYTTQPIFPMANVTQAILKEWCTSSVNALVADSETPESYFSTTDSAITSQITPYESGYYKMVRISSSSYGYVLRYHLTSEEILLMLTTDGSTWTPNKYKSWTTSS